jgi:hypothetical protein
MRGVGAPLWIKIALITGKIIKKKGKNLRSR